MGAVPARLDWLSSTGPAILRWTAINSPAERRSPSTLSSGQIENESPDGLWTIGAPRIFVP